MTIRHWPALRATYSRAAASLLLVLAVAGCRNDSTAPVSVAVVIVTPSTGTVIAGETLTLDVTVADADLNQLEGRRVTWSSSDSSVATVREGVVTAVSPGGPIAITATSEGRSGSAMLTVIPPPVASVLVTPAVGSLILGQAVPFDVTLRDARGRILSERLITWSSSDEAVATVSPAGVVTGVAIGGPVTITATSESIASTAMVTVILEPVAAVVLSTAATTLFVGESITLTAALRGTLGSTLAGRRVEWSSSNVLVARVTSEGVVTGTLPGPVTIQVISEGKSASVALTVMPVAVASVSIEPNSFTVVENRGIQLVATTRDAQGNVLTGRYVQWTTSDPEVAFFDDYDYLIGIRAGGPVTITATSEGKTGTATVTVTRAAIATIVVAPNPVSIFPGRTRALWATVADEFGQPLIGRTITWSSSDPGVATVSANTDPQSAVVTGVAFGGPVTVTASSKGVSGTAIVTVLAPGRFSQLASGGTHNCGVAGSGEAYCWGSSYYGQIGDNSADDYADVGTPSLVLGGLKFMMVTGGPVHSCGVTIVGEGYCWGYGPSGELGIGAGTYSPVPSRMAGGITFAAITAGGEHTCGLSSAQAAYCWGSNAEGQLGDGTREARSTPVGVAGGLAFTTLSAGALHTCGLTSAGAAYCWGRNRTGQLGDSTTSERITPVLVAGGQTFVTLAAGSEHTCGLTTAGTVYCWGLNASGQLGDGSVRDRSTPGAVAGAQVFGALAAGGWHNCAATDAGTTYCWGNNDSGQLGNGSTAVALVPTPVSSGFAFAGLAAGNGHSCGRTVAGAAYCWGANRAGQLGNDFGGEIRTTPVGVLGFSP